MNNIFPSVFVRTVLVTAGLFIACSVQAENHYSNSSQYSCNEETTKTENSLDFYSADQNRDSRLDYKEYINLKESRFLSKIKDAFHKMDRNGDAIISREEFSSTYPGSDYEAEQLMNNNCGGDGKMNLEEFTVMRLTEDMVDAESVWEFIEIDTSNDTTIDLGEFLTSQGSLVAAN